MRSGTRIGPCEMGILLVGGGMGEVFRARETPRNRHVVVKVLPKARTKIWTPAN